MKKRGDGYHEIASLYQAIDFFDTVEIRKSSVDLITCTDPTLPCDETNLLFKARELLRSKFFIPPLHLHLTKNIPMQAGLGGGSGNGATLLWGLNHLFNLSLTDSALAELGAKLGSDVPFFFSQGSAYCTGRGEILTPHKTVPIKGWIAKPNFGLSTPLVYKNVNLNELSEEEPLKLLQSFETQTPTYLNDLEKAAFSVEPRLKEIRKALFSIGFSHVVMSGSGTSFFCLNEGISLENDKSSLQARFSDEMKKGGSQIKIDFYPFSTIERGPNSWYAPL